ncbi:hypothetical protein MRX96_011924 [Rhipicephalus microplus]
MAAGTAFRLPRSARTRSIRRRRALFLTFIHEVAREKRAAVVTSRAFNCAFEGGRASSALEEKDATVTSPRRSIVRFGQLSASSARHSLASDVTGASGTRLLKLHRRLRAA